jgi:hypothetical protein
MQEMSNVINILFFLLFLIPTQKDLYYNKQGKPSTYGIEQYIKNDHGSLQKEYQYKIRDSIYEVYISTDNLGAISDENELGVFYIPDQIVITNEEKFIAYEFKDLTKFKQKTTLYNERTVKAVVFHELTHAYIYFVLITMQSSNTYISPEYKNFRIFPNPEYKFSVTFIEEGICEYAVHYLNECTPLKNIPIPDNEKDLLDQNNRINNLYYYSEIFLNDFLDKHGLKSGIRILLGNKPPTYREILKPELYYKRINMLVNNFLIQKND